MRTSRHALAALAASVLLWGAACGSGSHPQAAPTAPRPDPTTTGSDSPSAAPGPPTTLPWWSAGVLHLDEGTIRTPLHDIVTRGGTTIVGRATSRGSTWKILRGDRLVGLVSGRSPALRPVLSADGLHAAWARSTVTRRYDDDNADEAFTVSAYDVGRGQVTGSTVLGSRVTCCDATGVVAVVGVDADGSVVLARYGGGAWSWRPGRSPVPVTGIRGRAVPGSDQWPGGISWTAGPSSADPAGFGRVSTDGAVVRVGRVPVSQGGLWSPDGTAYVYRPFVKLGDPPMEVWSSDGTVRLRARHVADVVGWESSRSVVLLLRGRHGRAATRPAVLVRCDARTGDCEQAGSPLPRAVLPQPSG